jgi:hypothetical protein
MENLYLSTHKFRWARVIWKILTDKGFRFSLSEVILYALINAEEKRGDYASGVVMFEGRGYRADLLKKK